MIDSVSVEFSLRAADLRAALRSAVARRPWFWICACLFALLAVLVAVGAGAAPARQSISALATVMTSWALYVLSALVYGPYLRARRAAYWGAEQTWILDATGLRWQIHTADAEPLSQGQVRWHAITRIVETTTGLLIYTGRSAVAFLPASSLVDTGLRERTLELAKAAPTVRIHRLHGHAPAWLAGAAVLLVMVVAVSASVIEATMASSRERTARHRGTEIAVCLHNAGTEQSKLQTCLRLPGALPASIASEEGSLARSLADTSKLGACLRTADDDLDKLQRCAALIRP